MVLIVRCISAWKMHLRVRGRVCISASGLQLAVLCCSLRFHADGRNAGGNAWSSASGAQHPAPQAAVTSTEEPPRPRVSTASLTTLLSLCLCLSFFWFCVFISECCTQDCKSESPPRSRHPCKHTRVYLQAQVCVQVYPTQRSRDLDPEVSFSFESRACLRDLQKYWSNSSGSVYILIWGLQGH